MKILVTGDGGMMTFQNDEYYEKALQYRYLGLVSKIKSGVDSLKEDKKTWETYIKNPSDLFDKEKNLLQDKKIKGRFKYDLHGYSLDEANQKVKEIIGMLSGKEKQH